MTDSRVHRTERAVLGAAKNDVILAKMLEEERVESSELDTRLLVRLGKKLAPHKVLAGVAVFLAFVEALAMTMPAFMIGLTVDAISQDEGESRTRGFARFWLEHAQAFANGNGERLVLFFGLVVLSLWLVRYVVAIGATYLVQKLGQTVVNDFRVDVYRHITSMHQGWFHKNPVGRLVNRTTFDLQAISDLFSDAFAEGMRDLMFIIVLIMVMLSIDPVLAGILLCAFPLLGAAGLLYRWAARPAMRTMSAVQSRMNAWLAENLAGMREIHVYRREAQRCAEYRTFTDAHQASARAMIQAWGLLRPVMMAISACFTALILWVGYNRVSAGLATVGVLLTFLQYTTRLWVPVRNLTEKFNMIQNSLTAGERIMDVLDAEPKMTDDDSTDPTLEVIDGRVEFDDVRFHYPDTDQEILKGIDLSVAPGQMLALVGDTGAGKSTIVHLISRFYEATSGSIRIDGHDVKQFTLNNLRSGTALVPQDVVIFAGTIRENIALGKAVSDERIWSCLEAVRADGIVRALHGGLDHELEERGRTLSVGERQLLSFARALVFNPPVLILDEATANVDTETELRIQRALDELTQGRTSIVIAHRLSTIRNAHQIAVLQQGEVIERGTHTELLERGGEYARLQALHSSGGEETAVIRK